MADSTVPNLADGVAPLATDLVYAARSPYVAGNDRYLSWAEIMASVGQANPKFYSAVGDGTTDDTAAVSSAITVGAANGNPVFLPGGTFKTTLTAGTAPLVGPIVGNGQIIDNAGNKRGKIFNAVTSQPSTLAYPGTGIDVAFNGDLTHVPHVYETRMSGADTNGSVAQTSGLVAQAQTYNASTHSYLLLTGNPITAGFPSSGTFYINHPGALATAYTYTGIASDRLTGCSNYGTLAGTESISLNKFPYFVAYENYPVLAYVSNASGRSGVGSGGRTGAGFMAVRVTQESTAGGDIAAFWVGAVAYGVTGGATRWDQNSSAGMWAGGVQAGADGVYLDADEVQVNGSKDGVDYDVAAAGIIRNFTRNNDTGALGTWWNGLRFQSLGSKNVDVGMMLYGTGGGGYMVGIDMSAANLPTSGTYISAAMTLRQDQRVYFNASGTDAGGLGFYRRPDSTGSDYIHGIHAGGADRIDIVVGGQGTIQVSSVQATVAGDLLVTGKAYLHTGSTSEYIWYTSASGGRIDTVVGGVGVLQVSGSQATVNGALAVTGASAMSGALAMGGNKVTGAAAATAAGDLVRYEQLYGAPSGAMGSLLFPGVVDVQVFGPTASATWTKPSTGTHVIVMAFGPGGGGGGGVAGAASLYGGSGGGSGDVYVAYMPLASLANSVTVQVGAGGAGGLGSATTTGNAGSNGSRSTIFDVSNSIVIAPAGGGGGAGGTSQGAAGAAGAAGTIGTYSGITIASVESAAGAGGQSSITTNAATGGVGAGAAGAGITSGGAVAGNGGANTAAFITASALTAASTAGAAGAVLGNIPFVLGTNARYGGGGGAAITGASTAGAGGAGYTGGGGGGGGSSRSGTGGRGGAGGDGRLVVIVLA